MPRLLQTHHLVIGKACGAAVQEAIAAQCPLIVNQIIPGQEEGNAELVLSLGIGAVALERKKVINAVDRAFADDGLLWRQWRQNIARVSCPDASFKIAALILHDCTSDGILPRTVPLFSARREDPGGTQAPEQNRVLLCDFHIHSNYSDGKLTVPEVVDLYGRLGFDCICVTDHLADPRRLLGKMSELCNFINLCVSVCSIRLPNP